MQRQLPWTDTVIWWHCYPLGFVGAEPSSTATVTRRLPRLTRWLDYLIELGANGLLLGPIFASTSHGYDTVDYFKLDPRLGDNADLTDLLSQAKARGIRVVLDGVFNHVSRDHVIVQRATSIDATEKERSWLRWVGDHPRCFEGNLDLVELNLACPVVLDYVVQVMSHWPDAGVDGWRLDAAFAPGAGVWQPIIERIKARYPDSWILAEVIQADYPRFVAESGVDSVTQYELWKGIWSSLNDRNLHELAWALKRHAEFTQAFRPQTFIGNHDVTRIATKLDDPRHLRIAVALPLLLPGIPSIYAGDEQGFTGEKFDQPGGDDAIRPAFPDRPEDLSQLGRAVLEDHQRVIHLRRAHPWLVDATATVQHVTDTSIVITMTSGDAHLTLAINLDDTTAALPGPTSSLTVPGHDWALA